MTVPAQANREATEPEGFSEGESRVKAGADRLRLLSYNIQAGTITGKYRHYVTRSWRHVLPSHERVEVLDAVADLAAPFDIVGLQEVDGGSLRSGFFNQTRYIATHAGFPYWNHQSNRRVGKLVHASNGLLSRIEPAEIKEHRLPGTLPGRGALAARFGEGEDALHIYVVHLALGKRARASQFDYLADRIANLARVVVMGDMNCRLSSLEMNQFLLSSGLREPSEEHSTFPSWRPNRALDHILVSADLSVSARAVIHAAWSDHLPVALELGPAEAKAS